MNTSDGMEVDRNGFRGNSIVSVDPVYICIKFTCIELNSINGLKSQDCQKYYEPSASSDSGPNLDEIFVNTADKPLIFRLAKETVCQSLPYRDIYSK